MKKNYTISVAMSVWSDAQTRTDNISQTVEDLLIEFNKSADKTESKGKLKRRLKTAEAELAALKAQAKEKEEVFDWRKSQ